ncbi:MAG: 2-oxoisovalerate dehydrogenase component beta subunit, partial [Microbacteriaceae bacterium]|nr:2-oxoisovalerate dehydrogenase component beta subunit [Microbacteriaceae bacterium]
MSDESTELLDSVETPGGAEIPVSAEIPLSKALNAGLRKALGDDKRVLLMGEDIGPLGGVFRVTEGLQAEFGSSRVFDTPLAES